MSEEQIRNLVDRLNRGTYGPEVCAEAIDAIEYLLNENKRLTELIARPA